MNTIFWIVFPSSLVLSLELLQNVRNLAKCSQEVWFATAVGILQLLKHHWQMLALGMQTYSFVQARDSGVLPQVKQCSW